MSSLKKLLKNAVSPSCITVLSFMVLWGQIQNYMMRSNLSIIIVAMVKPHVSNSSSSSGNSSVTDSESCEVIRSVGVDKETASGIQAEHGSQRIGFVDFDRVPPG